MGSKPELFFSVGVSEVFWLFDVFYGWLSYVCLVVFNSFDGGC